MGHNYIRDLKREDVNHVMSTSLFPGIKGDVIANDWCIN